LEGLLLHFPETKIALQLHSTKSDVIIFGAFICFVSISSIMSVQYVLRLSQKCWWQMI